MDILVRILCHLYRDQLYLCCVPCFSKNKNSCKSIYLLYSFCLKNQDYVCFKF
ncbi:hypothetical protein ZOSMA_235G00100 [Zostera marina]|uniref:Uncharacterized protein n=1 Tax=Zostera marina TaxID=29655 RepID=A0A0K9PI16_ZOSMR|nr:hypothetical protein ZOSMA_235G00100 [Zostera marina]